jgi:hypothetical protein
MAVNDMKAKYDLNFKLDAVELAEMNSNEKAAKLKLNCVSR